MQKRIVLLLFFYYHFFRVAFNSKKSSLNYNTYIALFTYIMLHVAGLGGFHQTVEMNDE